MLAYWTGYSGKRHIVHKFVIEDRPIWFSLCGLSSIEDDTVLHKAFLPPNCRTCLRAIASDINYVVSHK
jgi:hypothetical protein